MIKKILLVVLLLIIVSAAFLYYKLNSNIDMLPYTCLFVVDEHKTSDEHKILYLVLLKYFPNINKLNILFINDNMTIVQKKIKSRTLNDSYYLQKENKIEFIKGEIKKIFTDSLNIDKYISLDIDDFNKFINLLDVNLSPAEYKNNLFDNMDYLVKIIYNIKFIKNVISKMNVRTFLKIIKFLENNRDVIKTDISSIDINLLKIYFALKRIKDICFIDIPTIEKRKRIEINENFIGQTQKMFLDENVYSKSDENIRLKVLNASKKPRMAIKAVDELRSNSFDVFEWGSYNKYYDYTMIINLTDNVLVSQKLLDVLKCGEVLYRFDKKPFEDITVILGKDCNIYDKIDRIKQ